MPVMCLRVGHDACEKAERASTGGPTASVDSCSWTLAEQVHPAHIRHSADKEYMRISYTPMCTLTCMFAKALSYSMRQPVCMQTTARRAAIPPGPTITQIRTDTQYQSRLVRSDRALRPLRVSEHQSRRGTSRAGREEVSEHVTHHARLAELLIHLHSELEGH